MEPHHETYDYVIIGGGTAGLALAARLSEDPAVQVAVLESGEDKTADPRVATPAMWPLLLKSDLDWDFRTTKQSALGGRQLDCPAGRVLGGTSSTNSFLFCPTSKSHVEAWSRLGNEGWDWTAFNKAVKDSYTLSGEGNGPIHLKVSDAREPEDTWLKVWTDTVQTLGFPSCDPFSGEVCGAMITPESIDPTTGQRYSSVNAYLLPARLRENLKVITGTTVSKILLDKKSDSTPVVAVGAEYQTKEGASRVNARKEVVLAAGALNSPRLLELSGIGGANLLQSLGIEVIVDNPHVGENLQNHVLVGTNFEVKDVSDLPSRDPLLRQESAAVEAAMAAFGQGKGPFATSANNAYAQLPFPGIKTGAGRADAEELVRSTLGTGAPPIAPTTPTFAAAHEKFVQSVVSSATDVPIIYMSTNTFIPFDAADPTFRPPGRHYAVALLLSHPLSRGSVHITDIDARTAGGVAVDPHFLEHPLDAEVLARGLRFVEQQLARAEPLTSHLQEIPARFGDVESNKDYVRQTASGANHWVGSCAMMPREMGGVVDAKLRVHGCANLRVCDASVVPLVPRGNTQAVVYGVAEMASKIIKESH